MTKSLNPQIIHWRDKSIWLIGASTGIGHACAMHLHSLGAKVAVSARRVDKMAYPNSNGANFISVQMDVLDQSSIEVAFERVRQHQGIDMVIYCAGHYLAQSAVNYSAEEMFKHNDVNYLGFCRVLSFVLQPMLLQGHGHISVISSVAGFSGLPMSLAYGPTKAALINLSESLYFDLHEKGIGVSLINPGFVETPLTAQNKFQMPAIITPQEAAIEMIRGWERGSFEIHFPKRFTRVLKFLRLLPYSVYFKWVAKATKNNH
jgi:short-subunit dehydrogenase